MNTAINQAIEAANIDYQEYHHADSNLNSHDIEFELSNDIHKLQYIMDDGDGQGGNQIHCTHITMYGGFNSFEEQEYIEIQNL